MIVVGTVTGPTLPDMHLGRSGERLDRSPYGQVARLRPPFAASIVAPSSEPLWRGAGLFAAACGASPTVSKRRPTPPAGSDLGAIEHVVYLMQENRPFRPLRHLPGGTGIRRPPGRDLGELRPPYAANPHHEPIARSFPSIWRWPVVPASAPATSNTPGSPTQCWTKGHGCLRGHPLVGPV